MGGIEMTDFIKNSVLFGLGLITITKEKAQSIAKELIKKGEMAEGESEKFVKDLMSKANETANEVETKIEGVVKKIIAKMNIPTKDSLDEINKKLDKIIKQNKK